MTAVDVDALDKLREIAAAVLRGHGQADHDPQTGTFDCRCGQWSGGFLSYHQADKLIEHALPDLLAEVRRGRALREAVEGLAEQWLASSVLGLSALAGAGRELRRALAALDES